MKSRMQSIRNSSTLMSSMPTLIPALSGIAYRGNGLPSRLANAVREFANVLLRIPNHAPQELPPADPAERHRPEVGHVKARLAPARRQRGRGHDGHERQADERREDHKRGTSAPEVNPRHT